MIKLNLLPPNEKAIIKSERLRRWICFYGAAITAIAFVFIAFLMITWLVILIQLNAASANMDSIQKTFKKEGVPLQEDGLKTVNRRLRQINDLQQKQVSYYQLLNQLSKLTPPGISLNGLSIDESAKAAIEGLAAQREQVLDFKDRLEKSKYFKNIASPLSNFVKETDINFSFQFETASTSLTSLND